MLRTFKNLSIYGSLIGAVLFGAFVTFYLQEFASDEIPKIAKERGISCPLNQPWLEVNLQHMTLSLFDGEVLLKRYNIGYGKHASGRLHERDGSTPLGEYTVLKKLKREDMISRGSRFMVLDFPSPEDAERAMEVGEISDDEYNRIMRAHRVGELPPADTSLKGPLGIQGNFFPFQDRHFTDGSIALSNGDMNELFEHIPEGTRVVINFQ